MANKNDLNEIYNLLGQLQGGQEAIIDRLERIETQTTKTNGRVLHGGGSNAWVSLETISFIASGV